MLEVSLLPGLPAGTEDEETRIRGEVGAGEGKEAGALIALPARAPYSLALSGRTAPA